MKTNKNDVSLFVDMDGTLVEWRQVPYHELYEKGFFRNGEPYENVVAGLKMVSDAGENPHTLSAYLADNEHAEEEKNGWLDEHTPYIPAEDRLFVPCGTTKASFVEKVLGRALTRKDVLLDDYSMNLHAWELAGGTGVKLLNGVNGNNGTWHGPAVSRFSTPEDIADYLHRVFDLVSEPATA